MGYYNIMCWFCGDNPAGFSKVSRYDVCQNCGRDLKVCKNCVFFSPGAYNDCSEPQAERITDKERSNFCEYFTYKAIRKEVSDKKVSDSKSAFDALFKD